MTPKIAPAAAPAETSALLADLECLRSRGPLVSQGRFDVYFASAWEIPHVLHEIGRLREITFRAVGEGTGRALDLDRFDTSYLHLFLWDRDALRVAGAYRLGCTDVLLATGGTSSLYTSTLFRFEQPFLDFLNPALELGRSFVVRDYQRSVLPLALLWRGIGRFVASRPRYARLFGPVSISGDYSAISQSLMVNYLRENVRDPSLSRWVSPLHPFAGCEISRDLKTFEEVSAAVSACEPDGKGAPVLLRQYLKLQASLLEFNVDPDFSGVLDALVMVDLRTAPAAAVARYIGEVEYNRLMGNELCDVA